MIRQLLYDMFTSFTYYRLAKKYKAREVLDLADIYRDSYKSRKMDTLEKAKQELRYALREYDFKLTDASKGNKSFPLPKTILDILDKYSTKNWDKHQFILWDSTVIRVCREFVPGSFYMDYSKETNTLTVDWSLDRGCYYPY